MSPPACAGCRAPYSIATKPPIEWPNTIGRAIPSASQKARTSSAHDSKVHSSTGDPCRATVSAQVEVDDLRDRVRRPKSGLK